MTAELKIKQEARGRLRDANWGKAVALTIALQIPMAVFFLCTSLLTYLLGMHNFFQNMGQAQAFVFNNPGSALFWYGAILLLGLLVWAVSAPLRLGASRWFYLASVGEEASAAELFSFYHAKGWGRALALEASLLLRMLGWLLLFLLPGILLAVFAAVPGQNTYTASIFTLVSVVCLVGGLIASAVKLLGYFAARTAVVKWADAPVKQCIQTSLEAIKGRKASAFVLALSFFGWALLTFFVLPILFVKPYFEMSRTTCSKWLLLAGETEEADEF